MPTPATPEPLPPDEAARLTDFARACKAAARIVSLYPPSHPAIRAALERIEQASAAATGGRPYTLTVLPDALLVGGRAAAKPDMAIGELATLLRTHLIDELTLTGPMTPGVWHAFLLLLSRAGDDVRAEGGFSRAWQSAGGGPIEIRQIDYSEVLRERGTGLSAEWDRVIATYLDEDAPEIDAQVIAALQELADDPAKLAELADLVLGPSPDGGEDSEQRSALLVKMLRMLADFVAREAPELLDRILGNIAGLTAQLPPGTVLSLTVDETRAADRTTGAAPVAGRGGAGAPADPATPATDAGGGGILGAAGGGSGGGGGGGGGGGTDGAGGGAAGLDLAGELRARIQPETVARFVANTVARGQSATARLAEAFQVLVPDEDQRHRVLGMAAQAATAMGLGKDTRLPELWENASTMLESYSDEDFVSDEYGRELSTARAHAIDVERIADDPPERLRAWIATVSDEQVRRLDQQLLVDLLRIEVRPDAWAQVLAVAVQRIEQLVLVGDLPLAQELLDVLVGIRDRPEAAFGSQAGEGVSGLLAGALMRHVVSFIRHARDEETPQAARFCQTLGPASMRPLAEALVVEDNHRAVRRLREVLLSFGAAVQAYADELRNSVNPSVRRTAIELLRAFGGTAALPNLVALLDDAEPQVHREAVRAIVQLGSDEGYAALRRALTSGQSRARDAIMQSIFGIRDARAAPLFAYLLRESPYQGAHEETFRQNVEALGSLGSPDPEALEVLKAVLYRGEWWAPRRTARLRQAAAA
ncbi:MAG: HEAT repeat domain-containing protein, partial [Vicinamibacterales bacterium]|nr:HEAT repeat domain-containing protein [Vicinamibacterales bacterium]